MRRESYIARTTPTLRDELRTLGFSVDFAHNRGDAIARARTDYYAAILVDFELPDADGISLIRRLHEQPETYKTPIVIISADRVGEKDEASKLNVFKWIGKPIDVYELAQLLESATARSECQRPCILHVDDDRDVLDLVARTLEPTASVISVGAIDEACQVLLTHHFDLAVLDIAVRLVAGVDSLPKLRNCDGAPIPVIIFSVHATELAPDPQVEGCLSKSHSSLDELLGAVRNRLMLRSSHSREEVA
jgi:CheY-like chemotaxis protein